MGCKQNEQTYIFLHRTRVKNSIMDNTNKIQHLIVDTSAFIRNAALQVFIK